MSWWNVMRIAVAQTYSCSFADWTDLFPLFVVKKTILIQSGRCGGCHPSRLDIKEYWPLIFPAIRPKKESHVDTKCSKGRGSIGSGTPPKKIEVHNVGTVAPGPWLFNHPWAEPSAHQWRPLVPLPQSQGDPRRVWAKGSTLLFSPATIQYNQ